MNSQIKPENIVGVVLALFFFPKDVAMACIIILALGDGIAPLAGKYGSIKGIFNKKKMVEGGVVGAMVAAIGAMLFVPALEAWMAAVFAMFAEGIDWKLGVNQIDDNIIMPLVAGVVIMAVRFIF